MYIHTYITKTYTYAPLYRPKSYLYNVEEEETKTSPSKILIHSPIHSLTQSVTLSSVTHTAKANNERHGKNHKTKTKISHTPTNKINEKNEFSYAASSSAATAAVSSFICLY